MAGKNSNKLTVPQGGPLRSLVVQAKLIMRLMGDRRVSAWVKLIPVGAFVYLVSPIDIIMGIPGIDALDDAAVVWFGSNLFVELCPPEVVAEHMKALAGNMDAKDDDEVVDAETTEEPQG